MGRDVLSDAIFIIDEVDQFFDEKDSTLVEKMMETDTAIGFTATMGARLGARYLKQRLGDRVVFYEFLPEDRDQRPFSMEDVTAIQFKMAPRPWVDQRSMRANNHQHQKQSAPAWEDMVLKVIDSSTNKLTKLNTLVLVDYKMDIATVVRAL